MRRTSSRIRDGYEYTGDIPAAPGEHGGLEFTYRPVLAEERLEVNAIEESDGIAKAHVKLREIIAQHLIAWSEWEDDKMVPINDVTVASLPSELLFGVWNQLSNVVNEELEADTKN
jgi:hypothetical protein